MTRASSPREIARMFSESGRQIMIDETLVADEVLFASHLDRGRYLGTSVRDRPQWLKKNVVR